ncbi:MAG: metallophosphoesterase family protein [Dehalococcoidia bacterium]
MSLVHTQFADHDYLRIGLISDTHIPEARRELWPQVFEAFAGVDLILHGGDIHELVVLDQLHDIAPLWAARGNGEDGSGGRPIQPDHPRLREAWLLKLGGLVVGLTHDVPIPEYPPHLTLDRALQRYFGRTDLDVLIYGDTHVEAIDTFPHETGETLCVNPGSPTYPHNLDTRLGTIGFLEISSGKAEATIWQLNEDGIVPFDWSTQRKWR